MHLLRRRSGRIAVVRRRSSVAGGSAVFEQAFKVVGGGEAVAVIHASCGHCDWGERGREAAAVRISVDGKYSQHLLLARGADDSDYAITLGAIRGRSASAIRIEPDRGAVRRRRRVSRVISQVDIVVIRRRATSVVAQTLAPFSTRGRTRSESSPTCRSSCGTRSCRSRRDGSSATR